MEINMLLKVMFLRKILLFMTQFSVCLVG